MKYCQVHIFYPYLDLGRAGSSYNLVWESHFGQTMTVHRHTHCPLNRTSGSLSAPALYQVQ